ncbi:3-deoxy-D-manno-octulosonic acid transferase [Aliidiomarina halalkaliphila]|uniref:3-deoxy-D-manno-octulosonic acid transferase n=1 Tax=Aliidiomarina halalkaliphila TaxID=2593535 RepID=A0A552X3R0_9GAMM|nr:lipid IV(A) 3-deoxy-D-manno-octulosonic acid transferase [Aliidiomarina halalkaliphila]TRW49680.1 3-deoxy-D-manno-octulosonic acid transferase [Aliidiomarina halalkaliphila]
MYTPNSTFGVRIYSALLYLFTPLILLYFGWQSRKNPDYRGRMGERFARQVIPQEARGAIMFHCVSVGEFMAARPLIERFLNDGSDRPVVITCMTPTASDLVRTIFADKVYHCYLPLDLPTVMKRFLKALQPRAVVILETELWPNLVLQSRALDIPVALVNGRMSEQSARGYIRLSWLFKPVWAALSYCAAQTDVAAERFLDIGVRPEALDIAGNLKFDIHVPPSTRDDVSEFKALLGNRPVVTAGSTHDGEETQLLDAFRRILPSKPRTLLILVPRHLERFDEVAKKLDASGLRYVRRSSGRPITEDTQVLLADSMGELLIWYGLATVAFVGGSLIERGGHNPLEPMAFGVPVISGRHIFNFSEIYQQLDQRQAVRWVDDADSLYATLSGLLTTIETAQRLGAQAQQLFSQHRGATARMKSRVEQLVSNT